MEMSLSEEGILSDKHGKDVGRIIVLLVMVITWRYRYPKVDSPNSFIMERGNFAEVYKKQVHNYMQVL